MMAVVGVGVSFLVVVFFYVGVISGGNISIREDNAATAAGGTFPHNQSAIINPHPEVVN